MGHIYIEAKTVALGFDHLYLVYTDDTGKEFVVRGGPETDNPLNFGNIVVEAGVPIAQSEDVREDDDGNPLTPTDRGSVALDLAGC